MDEKPAKMSRRDFLKVAGVSAAAAAVGAFRPEIQVGGALVGETVGRVVREARGGFSEWKYGKMAVRIDELEGGRDRLQTYLDQVVFNSEEKATIQEADVRVVPVEGGGGVQVEMRLGDEEYYTFPTSGEYVRDGKLRKWEAVVLMLENPDGSDYEVLAKDSSWAFFTPCLWAFAQGVAEMSSTSAFKVYLGAGRNAEGESYLATPFLGGTKLENISFLAYVIDKNGEERIFKTSGVTNTGPFGLNLKNAGAESVKAFP